MTYNKEKKIDDSFFDGEDSFYKCRSFRLKITHPYSMTPIYFHKIESEALLYYNNCNNDELRMHMPKVAVKTSEQALIKLNEFITQDSCQITMTLCVRLFDGPIGYIRLNSPIINNGLSNWSIDFWMGPIWRKNNHMSSAVSRALFYLKDYKVDVVDAIISQNNIGAQRVLEKCGFILLDSDGKQDRYGVRLN